MVHVVAETTTSPGADDEARRDPPHHRDHRRRAGQRRVLRRGARAADGQEDRQPGRPDRLPPLLRRRRRLPRRRPDVLRVPGRAPGTRRRRHGPPRRLARRVRRRRSTSGSSASPRSGVAAERTRATARCASPTPRGSGTSWSSRPCPTRRCRRRARHPARARPAGLRRRTRLRGRPRAERALLRETLGFTGGDDGGWEVRGDAARRPLRLRRAAATCAPVPGAGTVHHVAFATRIDEQDAWQERRHARGRPRDPGDRPLLLPLDLLPRAQRRAVRARHDGPGLRRRRGPRAPRRAPLAAAEVRAAARRARADAHPAARPAGGGAHDPDPGVP